jgi:putative transposase
MLDLVRGLVTILFASRSRLAAENLALRHQLGVLGRTVKRPRLRKRDRIFWVWLSKVWPGWRSALVVVKPATVVAWHRKGFRLYWRWKSRKHGRPKIDAEVRTLIRRMSNENPFWGAPRIQTELRMVGFDVAESTIANHLGCTAACDFFVVPTSTFRLLSAFVVLSHCRREIVHINVTAHPTAAWTAQQVVEAFPGDGTEPRFLIRDRDSIYGRTFADRVANMGIEQVITSYRSP